MKNSIQSKSFVLFHPNVSNKPKKVLITICVALFCVYFTARAGWSALVIELLTALLFYSLYRVKKINLKNPVNPNQIATSDKKTRFVETEFYFEDNSLLIELKKAESLFNNVFDTTFRIQKADIKKIVLNKNDFSIFIDFKKADCISISKTKEETHTTEPNVILLSFEPQLFEKFEKLLNENNVSFTIEDDTYQEDSTEADQKENTLDTKVNNKEGVDPHE